MSTNAPMSQRVCFVTIGATASFEALLRATLNPAFLEALEQYGYTDLRVQHGKDGRLILQEFIGQRTKEDISLTVNISGFDFNKQGLGAEMQAAKGQIGSRKGVVISHAGITSPWLDHSHAHSHCRLWFDT